MDCSFVGGEVGFITGSATGYPVGMGTYLGIQGVSRVKIAKVPTSVALNGA